MNNTFKPLVVGAPRSGFALLSSVLMHFLPYTNFKPGLRQDVLNIILKGVGNHVSTQIVEHFRERGIDNDLLYNPNFRYIAGGPKWINRAEPEMACFRKYIGVKGMGDFTLNTKHPRQVLNMDQIVHSHTDPGLWLTHPGYSDYTKFASVRNPVDILNSSVFSLNALASEYIQKFVPPEDDNDLIRQKLALYKFSDLNFFEGLVKFLSGYFEEFMKVYDQYILMRWEDLIERPEQTIMRLSNEAGIGLPETQAKKIWEKLDHVNLTQSHKHNYRVGHGVLGGWKNWITNHHLELIREYGLEKHMRELGYGKIELLDESQYTPFQVQVSELISNGEVYNDFPDPDLFTFAFNKSNLDSQKFPFKRYEWRKNTQIERSIFENEELQNEVWDRAEQACEELNQLIINYLESSKETSDKDLIKLISSMEKRYKYSIGETVGKSYYSAFKEARARVSHEGAMYDSYSKVRRFGQKVKRRLNKYQTLIEQPGQPTVPANSSVEPLLIKSEQNCNVVQYRDRYYALPHSLGPIEVDITENIESISGVFVTRDLESALKHAKELNQQ